MSEQALKNPPLIEALVEINWELKEVTPMGKYDPNYQFLLGVFHNNIKKDYPFYEKLPASNIPDDVTGSVVKHRFRKDKDDWPLVQIGPGVITINETEKYDTFDSFKPKACDVVKLLFDSYPNKDELNITGLKLRYIDAIECDYSKEDILEFISNKMHIKSEMPSFLFVDDKVEKLPISYSSKASFRCNKPPGVASFSIASGHKLKRRAIIWNQIFESTQEDVPNMPDEFDTWIQLAHDIVLAWFDGVINGKLKEEFNT